MALFDVPADKATEALMRAAREAASAAVQILEGLPLVDDNTLEVGDADTIAGELANALATVLSLKDELGAEDNQLFGALQRWLS